jgi:hypothetical protein
VKLFPQLGRELFILLPKKQNCMTLANHKSQLNSFQFTELLPGLVICEATKGDIHNWGNADRGQPAFLVYIGYNTPQEREEWIYQLRTFWKIDTEICSRASNRVPGYWWELKVWGMNRYSESDVFELEYLSESKDYGLDFLQYLVEMRLEAVAYEEMTTTRILTNL